MNKIPRFVPSLTIRELISAIFRSRKKHKAKNELRLFSEKFAKYIGVRYAIPSPSGRAALAGILHACALPEGKEVILPSLTFHCVPAMFQEFGLRPRFVDIDSATYCINVKKIETAITPSTVAIIPVHLYGRACNMDAIEQIAKRYNLIIIEDCAQSCGAFYSGKRLGSLGNAAFFSFHTHKNISVLGSGMVVTNSRELAIKISSWMEQFPVLHGIPLVKRLFYAVGIRIATRPWFWSTIMHTVLKLCNSLGFNLIESLTNEFPYKKGQSYRKSWFMPRLLHGRIGLGQLEKLDYLNSKRVRIGDKLLENLRMIPGIDVPVSLPKNDNVYASFPVQVEGRQDVKRSLFNLGIDTHMGNMSVGPYLPGLKGTGEYDVAAKAIKRIVHLPIYPDMDDEDLSRIVKVVNIVLSRKKASK